MIDQETCETKNVLPQYKSWKFKDVQAEQKRLSLPFAVAAMNVQGDLNIGVMLRSATMFCAERFFVLGKRHWDRRSAVGAHNYIESVVCPTETEEGVISRQILDELMTAYNYYPIFVELGGYDLTNQVHYRPRPSTGYFIDGIQHYEGRHPCLIFGNEHYGISPEYIGDSVCISIGQGGVMRSLNVSAAAAIVIHRFYEMYSNE